MGNRVVVITGASSGIGAELAVQLAGQGETVVLVARRAAALMGVAARCGGRAFPIIADLTRRDDVRRVVADAIVSQGRIDVWVNNAGQGITRAPSQLTDDDVYEMFRVNVMTAFYGMQETLPHFKERGAGHVINVSSMLGRIPMATFRSAYSASKHYLNSLTANFRAEVQETHPGIQYTVVSPGVVATEFGAHAMHGGPDSRSLPNAQEVGEVAAVIARVLDSRAPDVYTRAGMAQMAAQYFATIGVDG